MSISNQADFFLNFRQFGDLKLQARAGASDAAEAVAQQFEGLFLQQMLAAMRSAAKIDTGQDSTHLDFYQEMYDKQLAQTIAKQDRLGVARMILQQLHGSETLDNEVLVNETLSSEGSRVGNNAALEMPMRSIPAVAAADVEKPVNPELANKPAVTTEIAGVVASKVVDNDFAELGLIEQASKPWQTPHGFIADILPQARSVARSLGVSSSLLVAQAALETGWGKHTIKFDDGRNSFNLFGIKAGPDWQGASVRRNSLEFEDGMLQNRVSRFRAYATAAQSLADYAQLIQSSPRYQQALQHAGDDRAYIREIQNAGYATDPHYADKVLNILNGEVLQGAIASLDTGVSENA